MKEQLNIGWNEDWIIAVLSENTKHRMKLPSAFEAAFFAIEVSPQYLFNEVLKKRMPFGCHAWKKYQYEEFWMKYISTK